jgi:hypothetical protein
VSDQCLHFAFWRSRWHISQRCRPIILTENFLTFLNLIRKNVIVPKIRSQPLLYTPFGRFRHFYRPRKPVGRVEVQFYSVLDLGTRRGWGISVTPRPLSTPGKDPVPIVQEAGWAPGPVWTGAENLAPTGIRSPDRPTRSQSLYRLSYPAHYTPFPVPNSFYLTCTAWGKDSNVTFKIIPVVTVHWGKLTNKDMPPILSRICARKLWHRNVNFYFIVFLAYFMLVVIKRCTSLWEKAHVNCIYCEIVSVITMETRLFLIVISDGNQEGNLRGWLSHEVSMHARPTHSSILPLGWLCDVIKRVRKGRFPSPNRGWTHIRSV